MYDIIGDIHGHATLLKALLKKMGYAKEANGTFSHPYRKAVFIGDIINRGPEIRQTLKIVRSMVEEEKALAIPGNHEYNAITYFLKDENKKYIYKRSSKTKLPMRKTLDCFASHPEEWETYLKFFRNLPVFLDLGELRVVHACWNDKHIQHLNTVFPEGKLKKKHLRTALKDTETATAIEETLKGMEYHLPPDLIVKDSRGMNRRNFRMKWWESPEGQTFRQISFGNKFQLPPYTIPKELVSSLPGYPTDAPPVFFGHFSLLSGATVIRPNLCCIDSSVTNTQTLSAYRWDGEQKLHDKNIVAIKM